MHYYCTVKLLYSTVNLFFSYRSVFPIMIGEFVYVPLKKKYVWGIVVELLHKKNYETMKDVEKVFLLPADYKKFLYRLSRYLCIDIEVLYKKIILQLTYFVGKKCFKEEKKNNIPNNYDFELSDDQQNIFSAIINSNEKYFLLHGVTGSGKTYVYIALIKHFLRCQKNVIFLFPNLVLAHTMYLKILSYFDSEVCLEYHSYTSNRDREKLWNNITNKKSCVICGVHIPLLLPLEDIGLIIIDEEHDSSYVENRFPYINHKEAALIRAMAENTKIVLGSATPSLVSYYYALSNKYVYLLLKKRYQNKAFPKIIYHQLIEKERKNGISSVLLDQMDYAFEKSEQVILYFNKKGIFSYAKCKSCDYVFSCKNCSTILTIFSYNIGKCNRCFYQEVISIDCVNCGQKKEIIMVGKGLQKISQNIAAIYPEKKVVEIDGDVLKNKDYAKSIIEKIKNKEYDIIIGTHIITKGYNFDFVSLVGVLNVDQHFSIPHFMTMEEIVRQCIQVAGRAGRKNTEGRVVLQSIQDISVFLEYFSEEGYISFLENEIVFRRDFSLSPFFKIASLIIRNKNELEALNKAQKIYEELFTIKNNNFTSSSLLIMPLQKSFYFKVKKMFYYEVTIKATSWKMIFNLVDIILKKYKNPQREVFYIPNPIMTFYE